MVKKFEFDYDLIVIGSGAGGSVACRQDSLRRAVLWLHRQPE